MWCCTSKVAVSACTVHQPSPWIRKRSQAEYRCIFEEDRSIPLNCGQNLLELRVHLEEPVLFQNLCLYAQILDQANLLELWGDIADFKSIDSGGTDLKGSAGLDIYDKYIASKNPVNFRDFAISDNIARNLRQDLLRSNVLDSTVSTHSLTTIINNKSSRSRHISNICQSNSERLMLSEVSTGRREHLQVQHESHDRIFDELQIEVLLAIDGSIFQLYQRSPEYTASLQMYSKGTIKAIDVDDFEYFEQLGQGTFGFVVHCRKKSTGKHYAMKVQTKAGILDNYEYDLVRSTLERDALVKCRHPFIVSMDYALQTPTLALMVMDLTLAGTLMDSLRDCPDEQMPLERVRFYAAEISLALAHIHNLGMIYRDLKPCNVILCEDGHIKLVDLGGAIDIGGKVLGYQFSEHNIFNSIPADDQISQDERSSQLDKRFSSSHLGDEKKTGNEFASRSAAAPAAPASPCLPSFNSSNSVLDLSRNRGSTAGSRRYDHGEASTTYSRKNQPVYRVVQPIQGEVVERRAATLCGTQNFMAPEMIHRGYYDASVDYWSLGCVIFYLLTGSKVFSNDEFVGNLVNRAEGESKGTNEGSGKLVYADFVADTDAVGGPPSDSHFEIANVKSRLMSLAKNNKDLMTKMRQAVAIVEALLTVKPKDRLGSGPKGVRSIRSHPFFASVSWRNLCMKRVLPPFVPPVESVLSTMPGVSNTECNENSSGDVKTSFSDMMTRTGFAAWCTFEVTKFEDSFFTDWDFVSSSIVRTEIECAEKIRKSNS